MTLSGLTLDHVALVTANLGASRDDYEKLGFTLTRASSRKGRITADGPVVPWGSGNHCTMLRRGYFEILGLCDPNRYHEPFRAALSRFHGVSLIALGCESAQVFYESSQGGRAAPVEVRRDVPFGGSTREGVFHIVRPEEGAFPEAELLFSSSTRRGTSCGKNRCSSTRTASPGSRGSRCARSSRRRPRLVSNGAPGSAALLSTKARTSPWTTATSS